MVVSLLFAGCGLFITPQHRIATARQELKAGHWQAAAGELRTVVQAHPDNAVAWQLLAEVSLDAGDVKGAQTSIKHAIAADAKGSDLDRLRLRVWLAGGAPKAVIAAITGHTVDAGEPTQSLDLARAYVATGQADKALAILRPLLTTNPDMTQGRLVMAEALARHGQIDEALQQVDAAMRRDRKSALPPLLQGRILASRGDFSGAEQALVVALKRMSPAQPLPDRAGALIALTETQLAQRKIDAATRSQAALAALTPGAPVTRLLAARIDLARGNRSAAANQLEGVVAKSPDFIEARLYLGAAELAQGNLQQAQQQLVEVVGAWPDDVEARKLLASVRLRLGNPEAALSTLTPALETQAADPGLLALIGAASSRAGDNKSAMQALEGKLADSKDQTARLNLAHLQVAAGELGAAKSTLTAALAANPHALQVRIALAGVLARTKALPQALALLKAADGPGGNTALKLTIARIELAQGAVKDAEIALDQAIAAQRQPGRTPLVEESGMLLLAANQYSAALERLAKATVLEPGNALYWLNSARAQLALHQVAAARESLLKAARARPDWLPVVGMLAVMDVHAGNSKAALARVDAFVASHRNAAPALALKGYVEAALGNSGAALAAYTQAQKLHPTAQVAVQLYRARLASHQADPEKPLEDWLAREPRDWRVHEVLGQYYLGVRALHPATRQLEATLKQDPDNVTALNNLAWIYSLLGDPRAETLAERAYKLAPQIAQVDDTLGWILARRHQAARAVPLLARAVKLASGDPEIEYHFAYALLSSGKSSEARQVLSRLLSNTQPFHSRAAAQRLLARSSTQE
ncbi:MAG: tetratricopeptide repeat protein [Steroidobacteraceae bacterium]